MVVSGHCTYPLSLCAGSREHGFLVSSCYCSESIKICREIDDKVTNKEAPLHSCQADHESRPLVAVVWMFAQGHDLLGIVGCLYERLCGNISVTDAIVVVAVRCIHLVSAKQT